MHQEIADNIAKHGHHIYSVLGGENPRFCYTIGLTDLIGGELVLAGMCHVPTSRVATFINQVASRLVAGMSIADFRETLDGVGEFRLREADQSWVSEMLLGALDWYDGKSLTAWQLVVEEEKRSIDIPEMWTPFEPSKSPAWSWLKDPWPFACSSSTHVVTNLDALMGYAVSELMRWEPTEWEMFSGPGPDVSQEEMMVVPMSTLLGFDRTLTAALDIEVGTGLYREFTDDGTAGPWVRWETRAD